MRGVMVLLLALVVWAGEASGAGRSWVLRAGGGPVLPSADDGERLGLAIAVEGAKPLRPWFTLGLEAAWLRLDGHAYSGPFSAGEVEPLHSANVSARVRLQAPVRTGPVPFVEASNGVSMPWGGGAEYFYYAGPGAWYSTELPEASSLHWVATVGVGLSVVLPGGWPDPELAIRRHLWDGGYVDHVVEPRLALSW